jgi:hypothetical protein
MNKIIIEAQNLSKVYQIGAIKNNGRNYVALRDVISDKIKNLANFFLEKTIQILIVINGQKIFML